MDASTMGAEGLHFIVGKLLTLPLGANHILSLSFVEMKYFIDPHMVPLWNSHGPKNSNGNPR